MAMSLLQRFEDQGADHPSVAIDDVERDAVGTTRVVAHVSPLTVVVTMAITLRNRRQPRAPRG